MRNTAPVIGIAGAGKTGSGIARIASSCGHRVYLYDAYPKQLEKSRQLFSKTTGISSDTENIEETHFQPGINGVIFTENLTKFGECDYIFEAVIENTDVKKDVLMRIEGIAGKNCIIATSTSSLSVSSLSSALKKPGRFLGVHGVNLSPEPKLFEIVPGLLTRAETTESIAGLIRGWSTPAAIVKDIPGFLFNRLAYPFYHEALHVLEEGQAGAAAIDAAMTAAGFKAGPFERLNSEGIDNHYHLSVALFRASHFNPRFIPSYLLKQIAGAGLTEWNFSASEEILFTRNKLSSQNSSASGVAERVFAVMINYACDLMLRHNAAPEEIDLVVKTGLECRTGPLELADQTGLLYILNQLNALYEFSGDVRYYPSPLIRRMAEGGTKFYQKT